MCGIAGIVDLSRQRGRDELAAIAQAIARRMPYRGPDDEGVWVDPSGTCALAQRRLSIIDTSSAGHQPMSSADGKVCLTYNGEVYNYLELRAELEQRGQTFRTRTDTEVLIECMRAFGDGVYPKLDAMYALALWDNEHRRLTLARDPFGKKPLYYATGAGGAAGPWLAFASELHALAAVPGFDDAVEAEALAEYFAFQYIGAPRTVYRGAHKLPPGHFLHFNAEGRVDVRRHFEFVPRAGKAAATSLSSLADEFEDILLRVTKRRMIADVPLGAFLSGGVDSSTVVALMRKALGGAVKTFSIGFANTKETEHDEARAMAAHLGTEHHEKVLEPDILALGRHIATVLDEPNADSSCLPTYLLSQFAREQVTVALSGDGGDEMFGGYGRYFATLDDEARAGAGWSPGSVYYADRILVFADRYIAELFGAVPPALASHLARLRSEVDTGPLPLLHRLRKTDADHYMPGAVLAKVDRMSMQHSLEVRSPLLSIEVARFAEKLAADSLYAGGQGKLVLKEVGSRYIPRAALLRPKMGFGMPTQRWGKREILAAARDLALDSGAVLRRFLAKERLEQFFARQEKAFSLYQVWSVLVLESWMRAHPLRTASDHTATPSVGSNGRARQRLQAQCADEDLLLLRHVFERRLPVTMFCRDVLPRWWRALPRGSTVVSATAGEATADVRSLCHDWVAAGNAPPGLRAGMAVFPFEVAAIPSGMLEQLRSAGFAEAVVRAEWGWLPIALADDAGSRDSLRDRLRRLLRQPDSPEQHIPLVSRPWRRFVHDGGMCWRAKVGRLRRLLEADSRTRTDLKLLENGTALPLPDAPHVDIRRQGSGRYSVWGDTLFFSASDDSNPNTNGRRYEAVVRQCEPAIAGNGTPPLRPRWATDRALEAAFADAVAAETSAPTLPDARLSIGLVIGSLQAGGAERQLANLANDLVARGHTVSALLLAGVEGPASHYADLLDRRVELVSCTAPHPDFDFAPPPDGPTGERAALLAALPAFMRGDAWRLYTHLRVRRPQVVHCFLDQPNLFGAVAGWLADVPRIVLSVRNVNPTHFPYIDQPWFQRWYRIFGNSPRVRFSGNARLCCDDYARWLGLPGERFVVVRNGVNPEHLQCYDDDAVARFRGEHGLGSDTPVVLGVFRLSAEKRPFRFLEVIARVRKSVPAVRAFIAGVGALQDEVAQRIDALGLAETVTMLGRRRDVHVLMRAASLLLLTSDNEGTPNVALEAQWLERPVVCCAVGGCGEAVKHGETGLVYATEDVEGMVAGCVRVLSEPELQRKLGSAGRCHVAAEYSLQRMVEGSLALYR